MKLDLVFKDVRPSEELVARLESKFEKLEKMLHRAPSVHVSLLKAKTMVRCVARFSHRGKEFVAEGRGEDVFAASDAAFHKLETQVTKATKRVVDRRQSGARAVVQAEA
jgi:ribosomal subunit interface protein